MGVKKCSKRLEIIRCRQVGRTFVMDPLCLTQGIDPCKFIVSRTCPNGRCLTRWKDHVSRKHAAYLVLPHRHTVLFRRKCLENANGKLIVVIM